jgi:hypothetical protein
MTYQDCLTAAGAKVLAYKEFGDYSGRFVAIIKQKGRRNPQVILGSFGSCSYCDELEARLNEAGYVDHDDRTTAEEAVYKKMGEELLAADPLGSEGPMTYELAIAALEPDYEGSDDEKARAWLIQEWAKL